MLLFGTKLPDFCCSEYWILTSFLKCARHYRQLGNFRCKNCLEDLYDANMLLRHIYVGKMWTIITLSEAICSLGCRRNSSSGSVLIKQRNFCMLFMVHSQSVAIGHVKVKKGTVCCGQLWVRHMFCGRDL